MQVGSASGGNGIQDLHIHATNLRPLALKQVLVVCRFPNQLRVWRLDTSQSPHWRLAIARAELATECEVYLEPASIDSFGQKFEVTYTYNDGTTAKSSVVATSHTSDKKKIDRASNPGTVTEKVDTPAAAVAAKAEIFLGDGGRLRGIIEAMTPQSVTLDAGWDGNVEIPLLRVTGIWFGNEGPAGAQAEFEKQMAAPGDADVVFVLAPDKTMAHIKVGLQGLSDGKLQVHFQEANRQIARDRVLGIVLAAHPPLEAPSGTYQLFVLASGDKVTGRWVGLADKQLEIETPWNTSLHVPADQVSQIRVLGGRVTSLADFEPTIVEEVPYFSRVVKWRRDAGFDGQPARLRGRTPGRSICMHSRSVLTYDLDGQFERFKATLGFDDSAGGLGNVACRVLVDGREVFAKADFRSDQDPLDVDIDLQGAGQLSLEVDFGSGEDVGDRIIWAEPRLFRAAAK